MKTLLHLIDTRGPGGAETVFLNLLTAFDTDEYRSIPLVSGDSWIEGTLRSRGKAIETSDSRGSFNVGYLRAIVDSVRRHRVDLIQAHLLGPNVYASLAGILTGVPVVSIFHGTVDLAEDERFKGAKTWIVNRGSRSIVAVSHHLKKELERTTRLDPGRIRVIHNGVDLDGFGGSSTGSLRAELGLANDVVLVGSVGNIRPAKGYDDLVRAAAMLESDGPPIHFVVAGHPRKDLYAELLSLRASSGVEATVHFLGFREDASEVLAQSDIFLLPSTSEGFSISTIEAMATGVPVIATRSGGPEEIVEDGVDGVLVPSGDPAAMAAAVAALARDPVRRERFARAGRETVRRRFSLQAMVEAYRGVYESIVGGPGNRASV